jgi:hypothetical protein
MDSNSASVPTVVAKETLGLNSYCRAGDLNARHPCAQGGFRPSAKSALFSMYFVSMRWTSLSNAAEIA